MLPGFLPSVRDRLAATPYYHSSCPARVVLPGEPFHTYCLLYQDERKTVSFTDALPSAAAVAELSAKMSGIWYRSSYSLIRSYGNRSDTWLLDKSPEGAHLLDDLLDAQATVADLLGIEHHQAGFTYPQMARKLLDWLAIRQRPLDDRSLLIPAAPPKPRGQAWHFQRARPGVSEELHLYDLRSAYWQIAARIPSPLFRLQYDAGRGAMVPDFLALERDAEQRWRRLLEVAERHKRLRVALIGINSAGGSANGGQWLSTQAWCKGDPYLQKAHLGALQPMALLTIRCTYEVCQEQWSQSKALYANADCVVVEGPGREPDYWRTLGLQYREKAVGPGEIRGVCAWQVGEQHTKPWEHLVQSGSVHPKLQGVRIAPRSYLHTMVLAS